MGFSYSFTYAFQSFFREKWINLLSIFAIASSLLVVTLTFLVLYNVDLFTKRLPERFSIVVYLKDNLSQGETQSILTTLKKRSDVESVKYVSRDSAMVELK